jgi:tetratricopeptide (TPR) repeat protein
VIDLRPAVAHAHYRLGCIFLEIQRPVEANLAFETSARLNPLGDFVALFRAIALLGREKFDEAAALLEHLQAFHPESGPVALLLGEVELRQERYESALKFLQQAQRLDPARSASYYKAGLALRGAGRDWDALFELQEALRHDSQFQPAQLELNELYLSTADPVLFEVQPPNSSDPWMSGE